MKVLFGWWVWQKIELLWMRSMWKVNNIIITNFSNIWTYINCIINLFNFRSTVLSISMELEESNVKEANEQVIFGRWVWQKIKLWWMWKVNNELITNFSKTWTYEIQNSSQKSEKGEEGVRKDWNSLQRVIFRG